MYASYSETSDVGSIDTLCTDPFILMLAPTGPVGPVIEIPEAPVAPVGPVGPVTELPDAPVGPVGPVIELPDAPVGPVGPSDISGKVTSTFSADITFPSVLTVNLGTLNDPPNPGAVGPDGP